MKNKMKNFYKRIKNYLEIFFELMYNMCGKDGWNV